MMAAAAAGNLGIVAAEIHQCGIVEPVHIFIQSSLVSHGINSCIVLRAQHHATVKSVCAFVFEFHGRG